MDSIVFYSADDFGGCEAASEKIAGYVKEGLIQSVSIFGNCPDPGSFVSSVDGACAVGIHLDLTEGRPLSDPREVSLLVGSGGRFQTSFFRLWLMSILRPGKVRDQVYREASAQIENILRVLPDDYLIRIDSHRHFHMIPGVFRAVLQAAEESGRPVEYIRFPAEKLSVYLSTPSVWKYIKPVNLLKVLVLDLCAVSDRRALKKEGYFDHTALFCGVMFSGHMTEKEIRPIRGKLIRAAKRRGKKTEFLFHPGWLGPGETFPDPENPFLDFYTSDNRRTEAQALRELAKGE